MLLLQDQPENKPVTVYISVLFELFTACHYFPNIFRLNGNPCRLLNLLCAFLTRGWEFATKWRVHLPQSGCACFRPPRRTSFWYADVLSSQWTVVGSLIHWRYFSKILKIKAWSPLLHEQKFYHVNCVIGLETCWINYKNLIQGRNIVSSRLKKILARICPCQKTN